MMLCYFDIYLFSILLDCAASYHVMICYVMKYYFTSYPILLSYGIILYDESILNLDQVAIILGEAYHVEYKYKYIYIYISPWPCYCSSYSIP